MTLTNRPEIFRPVEKLCPLPFFSEGVKAGFPSPADDYIEKLLDLNELMISHPAATFFVRAEGNSMEGAGIFSGDILVVDRSLDAVSGKIIIAVVNGEFTVKKLVKKKDTLYLMAESPHYHPIQITPDLDFLVWGVVTFVIHKT